MCKIFRLSLHRENIPPFVGNFISVIKLFVFRAFTFLHAGFIEKFWIWRRIMKHHLVYITEKYINTCFVSGFVAALFFIFNPFYGVDVPFKVVFEIISIQNYDTFPVSFILKLLTLISSIWRILKYWTYLSNLGDFYLLFRAGILFQGFEKRF